MYFLHLVPTHDIIVEKGLLGTSFFLEHIIARSVTITFRRKVSFLGPF